jgi:hypothetical protein
LADYTSQVQAILINPKWRQATEYGFDQSDQAYTVEDKVTEDVSEDSYSDDDE